ncbi:MAG: response regulator transcription factor [Alphaproteobacteria bacterium]|nr:response regulator transcription factor [Alphaproteobacteria bacterium]
MHALIVDNHWVTRLGLRQFLMSIDPDTEVSEAATLNDAERLLRGRRRFDLCLLDFQLDELEPTSVLHRVRAAAPNLRVLIVSASGSRRLALEAVEQGAQGFVLKSSSPEELTRALQRVCEGDIWLPAGLRDMPMEPSPGLAEHGASFDSLAAKPALEALTPRQRQVLELIAMGKRNVDIAETLGISPRTVQIHVSTILKLLKVNNRTEAALLALGHKPAG